MGKDAVRCFHCGREFADHNYVPDSIDQWKCPVPVQESVYGYFTGGDPRKFYPDHEDCTPEEIANWKKACEEANRIEAARNLPCPSGWITDDSGKVIAHVTNAPFGIGVGTVEFESFFEPFDEPANPHTN